MSAFTVAAENPAGFALGHVVDFAGTLTAGDRRLVMAATGYDVSEKFDPAADPRVPTLVVAIAIERATGRLRGPVDAAFLSRNIPDADGSRQRALAFLGGAPYRNGEEQWSTA